MPSLPPPPMTNAEAYDDTCRRVYEGRASLYDLTGIDPRVENTVVVVSPTRFTQCVAEFRERAHAINAIVLIEGYMTIYGLPLRIDERLKNSQIRFRAEVAL